jgi:hypothetical protein
MIQHHFEEEIRRLESLIDAMMLINPNQLAHIKKKQIDFKFKERTMIDLQSKPTVEKNNNNNNNLKSPKNNSHDGVESSNHNNSDDNNDNDDNDIDNNSITSRPKSDDSHGGNRLNYDGVKVERSQSMDERGNHINGRDDDDDGGGGGDGGGNDNVMMRMRMMVIEMMRMSMRMIDMIMINNTYLIVYMICRAESRKHCSRCCGRNSNQ